MTPPSLSYGDRLLSVAQAWSAAATPWDSSALASLYTRDALLFGGRPGHFAGEAAIRQYFASYDGLIRSASVELFQQQILPVGEMSLLAQGFCTFIFLLDAGRRTRSDLRTTWLLDWSGSRTRIRAHHFSPIPPAPPLGS